MLVGNNFITRKALLISLPVAIILLIAKPELWILSIVIILVGFGLSSFYKKGLIKEREERKQELLNSAQIFLNGIKDSRSFKSIETSLMLGKGEYAFLSESTILKEPRSVRKSSGSGSRFRIMKGVSVGSYSGTSESYKEWRELDSGQLILTSKRIIFDGEKENRALKLEKIISVERSIDNIYSTIELSVEGRANSIIFVVDNCFLWSSAIQILKQVDNPLNFEIDLNYPTS